MVILEYIKSGDKEFIASIYNKNIKKVESFLVNDFKKNNIDISLLKGTTDFEWSVLGFDFISKLEKWVTKRNKRNSINLLKDLVKVDYYHSYIDDAIFEIEYLYGMNSNSCFIANWNKKKELIDKILLEKETFTKNELKLLYSLNILYKSIEFSNFLKFKNFNFIYNEDWDLDDIIEASMLLNVELSPENNVKSFLNKKDFDAKLLYKEMVVQQKWEWSRIDFSYWNKLMLLNRATSEVERFLKENNLNNIIIDINKSIKFENLVSVEMCDDYLYAAGKKISFKLYFEIKIWKKLSNVLNKLKLEKSDALNFMSYLEKRVLNLEESIKDELKKLNLKSSSEAISFYGWIFDRVMSDIYLDIIHLITYHKRKKVVLRRNSSSFEMLKKGHYYNQGVDIIKIWKTKQKAEKKETFYSTLNEKLNLRQETDKIVRDLKNVMSHNDICKMLKKWGVPLIEWENFREATIMKNDIKFFPEVKSKMIKF